MKTNLKNRPDYMSNPELYRVGDSINWTSYGLQCKKWFEAFEKNLIELLEGELQNYGGATQMATDSEDRNDILAHSWGRIKLLKEILGEG